jgi:hypothetical protein
MRPEATKLLAQIRRATGADQVKVLEWLAKKFPSKSEAIVVARKNAKKP